MKVSGRQIFLWHFVLCCLPLLLIYLSTFGVVTVLGWLTSLPALMIAGCIIVLMLYREYRKPNNGRGESCNEPRRKESNHEQNGVTNVDQSP